jgi:hypothetical protein
MNASKPKSAAAGLQLTPRLLIVGAITLVGWVWFNSQGEQLDATATLVLATATYLLLELVRAIPYRRILRALRAKNQPHATEKRRRRGKKR